MPKPKKILFHSCCSLLNTGFSRTARTLLSALHRSGKYELCEYVNAPFRWDDPALRKLPWKAHGGLPNHDSELPPNLDEQGKALVSYGHFNLDRVVYEFKPDVAIFAEDIWGVAPAIGKTWFNKINSIVWTPVDSLPLMELLKESAVKIPNFWVKAEFANRALRDVNIAHAKTVPDLIDDVSFFPVPDGDRQSLRQQVGLEDDCLVVGFVFRNQLRKLVGTLIDGFKIFQTKYPDKKAKLLLHTDWREPAWNIPRLLDEARISRSDVLTTFVCNHCRTVRVMPFDKQGDTCPACHHDALFTSSVGVGVTDRELNFIYNIMDAYFHPVTSGGVEMPCIEAMYAGLPLATVPYASCETYTNNPDVYAFDCSYYREANSNFLKSQPSAASIADAINYFHDLGREGRQNLGLRLREWSLEKFSVKKWISWIENYIDNLPEIDYDFGFFKAANDKYEYQEHIVEDRDFVLDLYQNVFNTTVPDDHQEFKNIMDSLSRGIRREDIFHNFIHHAEEFNRKNKKYTLSDHIEITEKKRLLYVIPNAESDCLASLPVIDKLVSLYPEYDIYVATEKRFFYIFQHLQGIKKLVEYEDSMDQSLTLEGQGDNHGLFHIVFNAYLNTRKYHNYSHNGADRIEIPAA